MTPAPGSADAALAGVAGFSVNFDSLGEAYGFPEGFRDPSFFAVADRFLDLARRHGIRYSIFLIGRDLHDPEVRDRVRDWAAEGHEIGNHSWSHRVDLGALPLPQIRDEVERAHGAITAAVGSEPRGFIAPGWSTSEDLLRVLADLRYLYDTSSAPSWIMYPALAKAWLNHRGDARGARVLARRDYGVLLRGPRHAHPIVADLYGRDAWPAGAGRRPVIELPLPTNRYRVACWHTLAFLIGRPLHRALLRSCLRDSAAFYYLTHPADLLDAADLDASRRLHLERAGGDAESKLALMEDAVREIAASGRRFVTLAEMAALYAACRDGGGAAAVA